MCGYPQFSFWIPVTLAKIFSSCNSHKPRKNTFVLASTKVPRCTERMHTNKIEYSLENEVSYEPLHSSFVSIVSSQWSKALPFVFS